MKYTVGVIIVIVGVVVLFFVMQNKADAPTAPADAGAGDATEAAVTDESTMEDEDETVSATVGVDSEVAVREGDTVTIDMVGTNYAYDMSEVTVSEGDTVTINFTSAEGFHDIVIDEFNVASEKVTAGDSTSVTFVADTAGTYEYYCSVGNHRAQGMVGTLVVTPQESE